MINTKLFFIVVFIISCLDANAKANSFYNPGKDSLITYFHGQKSSLSLDCEPQIVLSSAELNAIHLYWAQNAVRVSNGYRINQNLGSDIVMKAGFTIVLKPGTLIGKNNHYLARIEECIPSCMDDFIADKFFTPNGDGNNDYWNVNHVENISVENIIIYDRYGKIVTSLVPVSRGWDGTLDGNPLPATDYWYVMKYINCYGEKAEIKSHFSLMR